MAEASKSNTGASNKNGKEINEIHQNAIWRQLITFEHDCARNYPHKWGFMMAQEKKSPYSSGLPSRLDTLVDESILSQPFKGTEKDEFSAEEMKAVYLLTHQVRKLQLANGMPHDKYYFPATRSNELNWWLNDATKRYRSEGVRKSAAYDPTNSLCDYKLTRWTRG